MSPQRSAAAVITTVALVALGITSRDEAVPLDSSFTSLGAPTMPFVPSGSFISSSWFCPGVPAGEEGVGGEVLIVNSTDEPRNGTITVLTSAPDVGVVLEPFTVEARSTNRVDLRAVQGEGSFLSAVVEIEGGGGFVEQIARHPAGDTVSPCANATSGSWYFADGFSVADSVERLVVTNPYPDAAIIDVGFVTVDGERNPSRLQGYPIPGRSVAVLELGARDEPVIAARIEASRGRVVAARAQHYLGGGRAGYSLSLGSPSLADQFYFADGERAEGVTELYQVYNASEQEVVVDIRFLGLAADTDFVNDTQLTVPAGRVATLDTSTIEGLPDGRHGLVFSTFSTSSIVVERVLTRPAGGRVATSVVMGMPPGLASPRWSAGIVADAPLEDALVVLNVDSLDTTVSVAALGPGGFVPVPGLDQLPLPAGGVITIALTDPQVVGVPLVIESTQRLYVERLTPRGADRSGRSGSYALPG
jgi:hypothetical protein